MQGMDASKGTKVDGISANQLELLSDISGAFRPGMLLRKLSQMPALFWFY